MALIVKNLANMSFQVERGEILTLAGREGSGKSFLAAALANDVPQKGEKGNGIIRITDPRADESADDRTSRMAVMFERSDDLFLAASVQQEVELAPGLLGLSAVLRAQAVSSALRRAGLDPARLGSRHPRSLSTGEKRRLALATLLALKPVYLCLDEPFRGLDRTGMGIFQSVLRELRQEGLGIVVLVRDVSPIWFFCDRIGFLESGRVTGCIPAGDPEVVWSGLQKAGLAVPEELELWVRLKEHGIELNSPISGARDLAALIRTHLEKTGAAEPS